MDSPEVNIEDLGKVSKMDVEIILMNTDDSGYITATPSSAELTALSGGNSRRVPSARLLNSSSNMHHTSLVVRNLSTPMGIRSYRNTGQIHGRPKQLQDYFVKNTISLNSSVNDVTLFDDIVSNESCNSVCKKVDSCIVRSTLVESNTISIPQPVIDLKESMEWSDGDQLESKEIVKNLETDRWVENVLPVIMLNDSEITQSTSAFKLKEEEAITQPPTEVYYIDRNNTQVTEGIVSPVTETFSYSNISNRYNCKENFRNLTKLIPEKNEYLPSPILKCDYLLSRSPKKLLTNSQKIGTPEKNSILYNNLKPVNIPKKIKSSKTIGSARVSSSTKCRKKLSFKKKKQKKRNDYSGQKYIDFLKMLGEKENHVPAVELILSYLSCSDLVNVCRVSKIWNKVCSNDRRAVSRKNIFAKQIETQKENIDMHLKVSPNKKSKLEIDAVPCATKGHIILKEIDINNHNRMTEKPPIQISPPVSPGKRNFKKFMNAVKKHPKSLIRQCLRCQSPATVDSHWATCTGLNCGFCFCTRCLTTHSSGYVCCQRSIQSVSPSKDSHSKSYIGTKKSRRNLLRL